MSILTSSPHQAPGTVVAAHVPNPTRSTRPQSASAVDKALALYRALCDAGGVVRLSDLSRSAGLPKSTTHRVLNSLVIAGLVARSAEGYAPRDQRATEPPGGTAVREQRALLRRLAPFTADLLSVTGHTAGLAVLDGIDVVFAHRVYSHHAVWTPSDDSMRAGIRGSAAGRLLVGREPGHAHAFADEWGLPAAEAAAFVADVARIRRQGHAVKHRPGVTCLAVPLPVPPGGGPVRIAFTVKGPTGAVDEQRVLSRMRRLADAAAGQVFRAARPATPWR